jgi:hypothetical protein
MREVVRLGAHSKRQATRAWGVKHGVRTIEGTVAHA